MPRRYALVVDTIVKGARKGKRDLEDLGVGGGRAAEGIAGLTTKLGALSGVIGALGLAKVAQEIAQFAVASAKAYEAQIQAERQLEAAVKSTGGAAGLTTDELKGLASELQRLTGIGDEVLITAEAQLLTFTKIGRDAFPAAMKAAVDLSARMDQDLKTSVVQLGKALNDPVANLSALSRAGIQFSDDQKEVIKALAETGNIAEAQTIILEELETQFGGSAEAARNTLGGALKALQATWGDLMEDFGSGSGALQGIVEELIRGVGELRSAVGELKEGFSGLTDVIGFFIRLKVHEKVDQISTAVRVLNSLLGRQMEGWQDLTRAASGGTFGGGAGGAGAGTFWSRQASDAEELARQLIAVNAELDKLGGKMKALRPKEGNEAPDDRTFELRAAAATALVLEWEAAIDGMVVDIDRLTAEVNALERAEFLSSWAGAADEIAFALRDINSELAASGHLVADIIFHWDDLGGATDKWAASLSAAASILSALTDETKNYSRELASAGAAIGAAVGAAGIGDPQTNAQIGSAIGEIVGTFVKRGADRFVAEIATGSVGEDLAAVIKKVEGATGKVGRDLLEGIFGALEGLGDLLGAEISVAKFAVMVEDDIIKVFINGLTGIFTDMQEAIAFAVSEALRTSTITGVGDQVRAALTSGGFESFEELNAVLDLALELEGAAGQWATALRELNAENAAAIEMAKEHNLSLDLVNQRNQQRLDLLQREIDQAGASEISNLIGLLRQVYGEQFAAGELQLAQTQLLALQLLSNRDTLVELIAAGTALSAVAAGLLETVDATVQGLLDGSIRIRRRRRQAPGPTGPTVEDELQGILEDIPDITAGLARIIGDEKLIQELQIEAQRLQIDGWQLEIEMLFEAGKLEQERYDRLLDLIGRARDATDEWADSLADVESAISDLFPSLPNAPGGGGVSFSDESGLTGPFFLPPVPTTIIPPLNAARRRDILGRFADDTRGASPLEIARQMQEDLRREMEAFLPSGPGSPADRLAELNEAFARFARHLPLDEVNAVFEQVVSAFEDTLFDPLRELRRELLGEEAGSTGSFSAMQSQFHFLRAAALGGDINAIADLPGVIRDLRDSVSGRFGGSSTQSRFFRSQFLELIAELENAGIRIDPFTATGSGGAVFDLSTHSERQRGLLERIADGIDRLNTQLDDRREFGT